MNKQAAAIVVAAVLCASSAAANAFHPTLNVPYYQEWHEDLNEPLDGWMRVEQIDPLQLEFSGEIDPYRYGTLINTSFGEDFILDRPTVVTVEGWVDMSDYDFETSNAFFQFQISSQYYIELDVHISDIASESFSESVLLGPGQYHFTHSTGTYNAPAYVHWNYMLTIPEPSTASLFVLGLTGIAAVGRRRAN